MPPQLIPDALETLPLPTIVTVSIALVWAKFAVELLFAFMVTVHVAVPVHAPLQPVKVEPATAVAVSVTAVPLA